jgi:hypothetical protein
LERGHSVPEPPVVAHRAALSFVLNSISRARLTKKPEPRRPMPSRFGRLSHVLPMFPVPYILRESHAARVAFSPPLASRRISTSPPQVGRPIYIQYSTLGAETQPLARLFYPSSRRRWYATCKLPAALRLAVSGLLSYLCVVFTLLWPAILATVAMSTPLSNRSETNERRKS